MTGLSPNAELFDPAAGTWTPAGTVTDALGGQTATTLTQSDPGLEAAGAGTTPASRRPATSRRPGWTQIAPMPEPRISGQAVRLPDGRVLVAGGIFANSSDGSNALKSAVIFDPAGAP